MEKYICKACGGRMKRQAVDLGYTTAAELGRPSGAKGRDEFAALEACTNCEGVLTVLNPAWVAWDKWVKELPEAIDVPWENNGKSGVDVVKINKDAYTLTDRWGNFLYHLPGEIVSDLVAWVQAQPAPFLE